MEIIDLNTWPRKSLYEFFRHTAAPHFSITAPVDVTHIEKAKTQDELSEHIESDDWVFLSCLPWIHFTALTNPNGGPNDCIPRITWGKKDTRFNQASIPIGIQVHHALVDGVHVGRFFEALNDVLASWS